MVVLVYDCYEFVVVVVYVLSLVCGVGNGGMYVDSVCSSNCNMVDSSSNADMFFQRLRAL